MDGKIAVTVQSPADGQYFAHQNRKPERKNRVYLCQLGVHIAHAVGAL